MCVKPINIQLKQVRGNGNIRTQPVPCGRCPECKAAKLTAWRFRINKELERSSNPLFVTLTYTEDNVPWVEKEFTFFPTLTLNKRDVQLFMKRLRKAHAKKSDKKLVYYAVGEYGSKFGRPHYHMILFNLCDEKLISQCWDLGFVSNYPLKKGGISYVLKYISKPIDYGAKNTGKQREFSMVSKGIGSNYLTKAIKEYHRRDLRNCFLTDKGGYRSPLPKYYKEKIYSEEQRLETTLYLKKLSEEKNQAMIDNIHKKNPTWSVNKVLNYIENSKFHKKFDKNKNEVL